MRGTTILPLLACLLLAACSSNNGGNKNQVRDLQATIAALQSKAAQTALSPATTATAPPPPPAATKSPTPTPSPSPSPSPTPKPAPPPVSAAPIGGGCPEDFPVKVTGSKEFYLTTHPNYGSVTAVSCFVSAEAATASGAKVAPIPTPPGYAFGNGQHPVGTEVTAGKTYRTRSSSSGCYWERVSGFGGTIGEILANDNADGPAVITIGAGDKGFNTERCGTWTQDLSAITKNPNAPFGGGTYIVGVDIAPGTWRSNGTDSCYWARLAAFNGVTRDIIANNNVTGSAVVTISPSDKGFTSSSRCGMWTKAQ
jgi:hypothetical protein